MSTSLALMLAGISACLFGLSGVLAKRGLRHIDAQAGSLVVIGTTFAVYLLSAPLWMRAEYWFTAGFWIFALNGLIHPMLSMYLSMEAMVRVGPTVAATFTSTAPLFAAAAAVALLGESLNAFIALGTLGAVAGVMVLSWSSGAIPALTRAALVFATGAAVVRGMNHVIGKWGIELLPSPFMAGFTSFGVSFAGSLIAYRLRRGAGAIQLPRAGFGNCAAAGLVIAGAIACMYGALGSGPVVVVSPIVAVYPLFTFIFAIALGDEAPTRQMLTGVALAVGGVVLVSLGLGR